MSKPTSLDMDTVLSAMKDRGTTLHRWSVANRFNPGTVRYAVLALSDGPKIREVRRNLDVFLAQPIVEEQPMPHEPVKIQ